MAAQAALIADTIIGMKKALSRENDGTSSLLFLAIIMADVPPLASAPDGPITQPTNRGNKLHQNADHVRAGALGYIHPQQLYKQVGLSAFQSLKSRS